MKSNYILGISCFYHDSAAVLLKDGSIVACAQEERFTRKKHDHNFPRNAISWCLESQEISAQDVACVAFYDKPLIKFDRLLYTFLTYAPLGIRQFIQAMPLWLKQKLWISQIIQDELHYKGKILFADHHESHAASAFYPSPFKKAAIITMDGVGEWETASFGVGEESEINLTHCLNFPHSLGLLYSAFTYYAGFKVNSGEYKLMGLAPYGEATYTQLILDNLIDLKDDGSFKLNMKYFGFGYGMTMTNKKFHALFGDVPREPETKISQKHMDIAASIQRVTEEIMLRMARHVHKVTGCDSLCLAGGVALNCVGNGRIFREGPFKNIWVQPASGDAGGALGAAQLAWYKYFGNKRIADNTHDSQKASLLGPAYSDKDIESYLLKEGIAYKKLTHKDLATCVADLIAQGNVIGWFQGAMEFGPRALGARSIIGDARNPQMQSKMNLKIKYRESFRPFAPTVLRDKVHEWFDLNYESPYMLLVAPVKDDKKVSDDNASSVYKGFDRLKKQHSKIPAVTHVDYSARIQTITREENALYYDMINEFYKKTGCPVIINTSFNVRGEPLVCTVQDAYRCFMRTEIDYLIMGSFVIAKKEQKSLVKDADWKKEFVLD